VHNVPAVVLGSTRYGRGGEDGEELGGLGDTTRTLPADYLAALMALFLLMVADRTVSSASVVTAACCWPIGDCSNGMKDFHSTFCIRFQGAKLLLLCCPMCMCSNTHLLYVTAGVHPRVLPSQALPPPPVHRPHTPLVPGACLGPHHCPLCWPAPEGLPAAQSSRLGPG
jgi:hypothetical protein